MSEIYNYVKESLKLFYVFMPVFFVIPMMFLVFGMMLNNKLIIIVSGSVMFVGCGILIYIPIKEGYTSFMEEQKSIAQNAEQENDAERVGEEKEGKE